MIRSLWLIICLSAFLLLMGCAGDEREFPKLGQVTRIRVVDNMDHDIGPEIIDKQKIEQIAEFVDSRRSGWTKPWYGIPVPGVCADFYDGTIFKGHFGAGINFFETNRSSFWSKNATASEIQQFLGMVAVPREKIRR
jgi:hypothetical protein